MGFMGDSARTRAQIFAADKPKNIPEEEKAFAEILTEYAKENRTVTIPEIQKHFSVNYYTAFEAVKSLVESQVLKFTGGINYECLVKEAPAEEPTTALEKANADHGVFPDARLHEFIKRLRSGTNADDNDDDNADDRSDNVETDEEELRYRALKLCVEMNEASVSMLQRKFPIGYIKACKLIDWMEDKGYVSVSEGSKPRKILITKEEFDKIFTESGCRKLCILTRPTTI